ncbi:DNA/RNA non-specific endonuclease [Bacillus altitudinis]|nr:DNA/RNA non-specific endonuclease [Bacillus altitudinis]MDX2363048.1 DNA/RNA non-specific endonuclease [Bacillus altitudinis]
MYYDAKAFHEKDVYKNHDQIDAQVKAYLKVKKDEKEKRRIKELKEKLNDPSCLSEAKYFEIVDEIGYENLTYDQKMYYSQLLQGSGDIDNLVPMNSQINRSGGKWYEMEQKWRKALASDPPKRVEVIIEPKYLNDSIRPSEFGVFYSIEGKEKYLIIENKIGG